jgi:hypothetical protein
MYELDEGEHERVREIDAALEAIQQERSALVQHQVSQVQIAGP